MGHFALGDQVMAPWAGDGFLYPAVLVMLSPVTVHVAYLDGDEGDAPFDQLRPIHFAPGMHVQVNWKGQGQYYGGTIQAVAGMAIQMTYDDGDAGWATIAQARLPLG